MNLSLYQISHDLKSLIDAAFDPETGEASHEFEAIRAQWGNKSSAVAAYILNTDADAAQCASAIERITEMKAAIERKSARLRAYLLENMAAAGITEVRADDRSFSAKRYIARDKSVDVFDAAQVPADYMREIPARWEPNKSLIAKAVADGYEVPGARVVARDRLTIR